MSFSSAQITRSSLAVLVSIAVIVSGGCSTLNSAMDKVWPWGEDEEELRFVLGPPPGEEVADEPPPTDTEEAPAAAAPAPEPVVEAPEEQPPIRPEDMLVYWETIRGGVTGAISGVWARTRDAVAGTNYIQFVRPVALTVRDDYLYVVDAGLEQVLRYHRVTGQIETLLELRGVTAGEVSDIYVTPDYSFYLADTFGSRVLLFDPDGDLQRVFSSRLNLSHPVGVVEEENTGRVLVADGEFDHILVFNQAGGLETAIGGRGEEPGQFLNIQAFATGPNGLYIAARVGQKVQVLDPEGFYLYSLEQESVRFPMAIVSGEDMEVFVSDYLDNTIKLFERGRLVASIGGTGVGPGQFKRVTDLALADGFLYVADSLNGRVQVLRVATGPASVVAEEGAQ